ncbi:hypothetical protein RclHR1_31830003 [Rhizophagus clarus]|uniref:Zinc-ribbon domain-containing protein n=1 Tax=Rhizophagus clarus TaxID=94130 RepID=A0A2Z6R832_9GLOM|nr:hypothetical protein RclHR1_31830003 [Rhizophagus clarus]
MATLTLDIAKEIARSRGGECVSESYINCQVPMFWKCAKDHLWSANLNCVKNSKTWCPWCAVENRRTRTIEDMRKFAERKGGLCLSTEYFNRRDPLEWQCKEGHKWKASAKDILKGTWCRRCSTLGQKHVIQRRDQEEHQPINIANIIAQERGGKFLSTEYVNASTQMLWRCAKGHEWSTTLYRIKNMGRWCSQCAGNFPCGLSEAKEIAHSRGGMCLSTEYINLCDPIQWMCNKGHKWFASFNSIKHVKSWCPYCINKHENLCREVITNILGRIRRPDFLKIPEHPRGLELDIYYPQYGFAIEVQGKQHEQHIKYFHKDPEEFQKQLMRDQIKKELCEENCIALSYVCNIQNSRDTCCRESVGLSGSRVAGKLKKIK